MREQIKDTKKYIKKSRYIPFGIVLAIFIVIGFFAVSVMLSQASGPYASDDKRVDVEAPKSQETLNKILSFSVKDEKGDEVTKVRYELLNAELRDQIIVKGQKATAVDNKTFLIINIKITNDYDKPMQINARDYVRLIVSGSKEKLAPEMHNDPVEVQAISTKYTRLGFSINDDNKDLVLQIGEVGEKKETIKLELK